MRLRISSRAHLVDGCRRVPLARPARLLTRAAAIAEVDTAADDPIDEDVVVLQPVDKIVSARVIFDADSEASVEYLAKWKEDGVMTWEPTANLSEDLIRDFEETFWQACKTADTAFLVEAVQYGGAALVNIVNSDGRAPLHFAAALNNTTLVNDLLAAGADVDVQDPEGYTPLHMAAGYLHVDVVNALLAGGADMTRPDRQGRDVVGLVDSLRERITSAAAIQQRMRLESVAKALVYFQYEDVAPAAVLRKQEPAVGEDGPTMYLVSWRDESPDSWVPGEFVSDEVKEDFEAGLEYAQATDILASRESDGGCGREYLVRWSDSTADSWESEDNIVASMVQDFERERRGGDDASGGDGGGSGESRGTSGSRSAVKIAAAEGATAEPAAAVPG